MVNLCEKLKMPKICEEPFHKKRVALLKKIAQKNRAQIDGWGVKIKMHKTWEKDHYKAVL